MEKKNEKERVETKEPGQKQELPRTWLEGPMVFNCGYMELLLASIQNVFSSASWGRIEHLGKT